MAASGGLRFVAPDLPGHGATQVEPVDVETTLESLAFWLESFQEPLPVMGYSLGGRIALLLAVDRPDLISHLVLISSGAGIEQPAARMRRQEQDEKTADRIESVGVAMFLEEWVRRPITSTTHLQEAIRREDLALRSANSAAGLAAALRGLGQGVQPFAGDRVSGLPMPLLAIAGGNDRNYRSVALDLAAAASDGTSVVVGGVAHNVVLEAPERVAAETRTFLASSDSRRPHEAP